MKKSDLGHLHRTALVCVDSYDNGVLQGRLFHPCNQGAQHFTSLSRFLMLLEKILDDTAFPQSFNAVRTFSKPMPPPLTQLPDGNMTGKKATFSVWILFRQNTSWQGTVRWLEEGREESFRSALELIFLMDSVLGDRKNDLAG